MSAKRFRDVVLAEIRAKNVRDVLAAVENALWHYAMAYGQEPETRQELWDIASAVRRAAELAYSLGR